MIVTEPYLPLSSTFGSQQPSLHQMTFQYTVFCPPGNKLLQLCFVGCKCLCPLSRCRSPSQVQCRSLRPSLCLSSYASPSLYSYRLHIFTCLCMYVRTYVLNACVQGCTYTRTCKCLSGCLCMYQHQHELLHLHPHLHTDTHTHTHRHGHTQMSVCTCVCTSACTLVRLHGCDGE